MGEIAQVFDNEDKWKTAQARAAFQEEKERAQEQDSQAVKIEEYTRAFTRACLLLTGYHAPKRQWRKIRK